MHLIDFWFTWFLSLPLIWCTFCPIMQYTKDCRSVWLLFSYLIFVSTGGIGCEKLRNLKCSCGSFIEQDDDDDVATAITTPDNSQYLGLSQKFSEDAMLNVTLCHRFLIFLTPGNCFPLIRWSFLHCRPPCRQERLLGGRRKKEKRSMRVIL